MGSIKLKNYNCVNEYYMDNLSSTFDLNISETELISYAVSAGGFSNRAVTPAGVQFYASLVRMALTDGIYFTINDDYRYSEPSIKNSISFFMGMIAAKAIADKKYHIAYLFHLKDPQIEFTTTGKTPDFFGLANGAEPTLLEAKGTTSQRPSYATIENAKNQLSDICEIEVLGWNTYQQFQRHVVASGFDGDVLTYYDVDPESVGDKKIGFNIDKAIVSYYKYIVGLLSYGSLKHMTYKDRRYLYVELDDIKIGLSDSLYSYMQGFYMPDHIQPDQSIFKEKESYIYKEIISMSNELPEAETHEKFSLRQDGIICFV